MDERSQLARLVQQWNENRLDLFHLSHPTEDLEIEGVMRFYFQDGDERVLTKCVRVSSTATTRAVVDALADKFLPDLKMLTDDNYSLWEVHEHCSERKLDDEEKPLLVQLNWHRDDREGRFLLRREHQATIPLSTIQLQNDSNMVRKERFSKKEKKESKKKNNNKNIVTVNCGREEPYNTSDIYRQIPENTFTRTISNPEVVMKRKREQKLEARLKEMNHGGSLKVYGGELVPSRPYVSILVSIDDPAHKILNEALEKYGLDARQEDFVLVELPVSGNRRSTGDLVSADGRIVEPTETPLRTMRMGDNGADTYLAIRRAPSDYRVPSTVVHPHLLTSQNSFSSTLAAADPAFLVLNEDLSYSEPYHWVTIRQGATEVGNDRGLAQYSQQSQNIYIDSDDVCGRHCVLTYMDGVVTITPSSPDALIQVDNQRVTQTQILQDGQTVVIGERNLFMFVADKKVPLSTQPPPPSQPTTDDYCDIHPSMFSARFWKSVQMNTSQQQGEMRRAISVQQMDSGPSTFSSYTNQYDTTPVPARRYQRQNSDNLQRSSARASSTNMVYSRHNQQPSAQLASQFNFSSLQLKNLLSGSSAGGSRQSSDQYVKTSSRPQTSSSSNMGQLSLPISLQIGDYKVWDCVSEVMTRGYADCGSFRLAPAYTLYFALRFFHSHSRPYIVQFLNKIVSGLKQISTECINRDELLFWLANASELSFIVEKNPDLPTPRSGQLGSIVEVVFDRLVQVLHGALRPACVPMMNIRLNTDEATADLISLLDSTLRAARASRLNPALTIQLSSHMFHTINAVIFNNIVGMGTHSIELTTRFGRCLIQRLEALHNWADQMGVELAAECHLDRCRQAAKLLAAQKNDVAALGATCYKLNSLQVRYLLSNFAVENGEIPCDNDVIQRIVNLAERQADQLSKQDGLPVNLEETKELSLPFLLPQDGYTAEHIKTVPDGLHKYLLSLQEKNLCHSVKFDDASPTSDMVQRPDQLPNSQINQSSGGAPASISMQRSASQSTLTSLPNTLFGDSVGSQGDDIIRVTLKRGGGGIGLSIVAAQGVGDRQTGIYVKKVVDGSPAAADGRLGSGDQLISVNGQSLLGITQEDAAQLMSRAGAEVHFEVRKGAASRNGLQAWLTANTPVGTQAAPLPIPPVHNNNNNSSHSTTYVPPSPAMSQSLHSHLSHRSQVPPPSYSNYSQLPKYGSQQSVSSPQQPPAYQQRHQQLNASRGSAFHAPQLQQQQSSVEPLPRHVRSISASELYQNDPNATFSQQSIMSSGFDKLPAHYRHSSRPTVVQPGRPCPSPSALRRNAQSPVSMYQRPPSVNGLQRPPSETNLFAPPKSPNPLQQQGYCSNGLREGSSDTFRASMSYIPPQAQSSPINDLYSPSYSAASLPAPIRTNNNNFFSSSNDSRQYHHLPPTTSSSSSMASRNLSSHNVVYQQQQRYQEPVVVRPSQLERSQQQQHVDYQQQQREDTRLSSGPTVRGAVPTAITQALALQAANAQGAPSRVAKPSTRQNTTFDRDMRDLERTSHVFLTRESIDDELDRLDAKGVNMTEEETRRYRELVNENSALRQRQEVRYAPAPAGPAQITAKRRTETLIDDVEPMMSRMTASENISPPDARRPEKKSVQFKDELAIDSHKDSEMLDSPGIVGANEVYRDPRQRRLNELQERQVGQPDGARLEFRDKMKLFAHQIGEGTPKNKYHSSSAERQIQQE